MPRFYCLPPILPANEFVLPDDAAQHVRVLRLRVGESIELFDGLGGVWSATLAVIERRLVVVRDMVGVSQNRESSLPLILAQAISSQEKMDWVIQKATELGVAQIQPLVTQRCAVKLSEERSEKRQAHWEKVVISACEQCGRNVLPQVLPLTNLADWLQTMQAQAYCKVMFLPQAQYKLADLTQIQQGAALLIGPEGGFAPDEVELAQLRGFQSVVMGPRVLRTETAALAGIAAMQALWGDFRLC